MKRDELEHAIHAACQIVRQEAVIVIGSQAILGSFHEDELPEATVLSVEVDVRPLEDDDAESLATALDGAAGEWSAFHERFGYYIQGVGRRTAVLPHGWHERLVEVRTQRVVGGEAVGLCLEPHDLCAAKLVANREKDHLFVRALIDADLVDATVLRERLLSIDKEPERVDAALRWLSGHTTTAPGLAAPRPQQP